MHILVKRANIYKYAIKGQNTHPIVCAWVSHPGKWYSSLQTWPSVLMTKWLRTRNPDQNREQISLPAKAAHPMLARVGYYCHRTREQLDDLVQIAVTGLDSAHPQLDSLLSFLVPQNHSSDQSSLGLLFTPASASSRKWHLFSLEGLWQALSSPRPTSFWIQLFLCGHWGKQRGHATQRYEFRRGDGGFIFFVGL